MTVLGSVSLLVLRSVQYHFVLLVMIAVLIFSLSLRSLLAVRMVSCFPSSLPLALAICPFENCFILGQSH